jgi:prevent-host-death family protein
MEQVSVSDVEADLSAYLERCRTNGPVIITQNGKRVAVLIAPRDEDDLERLVLAHSPRFQALLERSRESLRAGKGLTPEEFWQTVERSHEGRDCDGGE